MVLEKNPNTYRALIAAIPNHSHEINPDTVEWVSVYLRKCTICLRRKIYSKKMFYCKVCDRYAHKRCLQIECKRSAPRVRFADTVPEDNREYTDRDNINIVKHCYDTMLVILDQHPSDSDDERLNFYYPKNSKVDHSGNESKTRTITNNGSEELIVDQDPVSSLEIERLTQENEHFKQKIKILEDKLKDDNILLRKMDRLKSIVDRLVEPTGAKRKSRNYSQNSVPETCQPPANAPNCSNHNHSSCGICDLFKNELNTLKIELEKKKIPNTPAIGKNESRHKNIHAVPKLDEQAYINPQTRAQRKKSFRNYLEGIVWRLHSADASRNRTNQLKIENVRHLTMVENIDFWTNAIRRMTRTSGGRAEPFVDAVTTTTNVRAARTGPDGGGCGGGTATDGDQTATAIGTCTAPVNRCTVVAIVGRLPNDYRVDATNLIFVDDRGHERTVTHEKALLTVGIPSRCLRFLSQLMERTIRDGKDCTATAVLRDKAQTPAKFTVMRAQTSYVTSSPGGGGGGAFFRIRVDAFETSLERTVHDYFVMAYERRGETIRTELFDLPETSDIFGAYR